MEGFWGIVKSKIYYLSKFEDFETLKIAIDKYIHYYNNERFQAGLKNTPPVFLSFILSPTFGVKLKPCIILFFIF